MMTVSRVLRGAPGVSDETLRRILRIVEETGYVPNLAARTLVSNDSRIVAAGDGDRNSRSPRLAFTLDKKRSMAALIPAVAPVWLVTDRERRTSWLIRVAFEALARGLASAG